jgi:replicative DNA helicase
MHEPLSPADVLRDASLPHSRDTEMALLGSMILDNKCINNVAAILKAEDFAYPAHQTIYRAILGFAEKTPELNTELVVLRDKLADMRMLEAVGGADYLVAIVESTPNPYNAPHYAKTVREKAILRQLIESCAKTIHDATQGPIESVADIASTAFTRVKNCMDRLGFDEKSFADHLKGVFHDLEKRCDGVKPLALSTGIATLDDKLGGLRAGYYVIAGRAKMGKTSLALNIIEHLAVKGKTPAAIITLESTPEEIIEGLITSRARLDSAKVALGKFSDEEYGRMVLATGDLHDTPLHIHSARTPAEVENLIRRLYAQKGIKLAVTDYLQRAVRNTEKENEEIARFSNALCNLAQQELRIPIIALAQVVKEVDKRDDRHPKIGDIYGPSSIGHDADAVLMLYRDDFYDPNSLTKGTADVDIVQRKGANGRIQLKWEGEYRRFSDLDKK